MAVVRNSKPPRMIRQAELAAYRQHKAELAALMKAVKAERAEILRLLEAGVRVEPGPLGVRVQRGQQQRVTKSSLVEALGEPGYEELRRMVEPTAFAYLYVEERPDRVSPHLPDRSGVTPRRPAGRGPNSCDDPSDGCGRNQADSSASVSEWM